MGPLTYKMWHDENTLRINKIARLQDEIRETQRVADEAKHLSTWIETHADAGTPVTGYVLSVLHEQATERVLRCRTLLDEATDVYNRWQSYRDEAI